MFNFGICKSSIDLCFQNRFEGHLGKFCEQFLFFQTSQKYHGYHETITTFYIYIDFTWVKVCYHTVLYAGHPNVKLFISHGGLMGIQDALYSGVPVIGIPMFADQFSNINFIVQNECGLQLQFEQIDERTAYEAMSTVLQDNK